MNILPLLAIDLEVKLKALRKSKNSIFELFNDHEFEFLDTEKRNSISKLDAEILTLERCYSLVVVAIKNARFGETFENYMKEQSKELDFSK